MHSLPPTNSTTSQAWNFQSVRKTRNDVGRLDFVEANSFAKILSCVPNETWRKAIKGWGEAKRGREKESGSPHGIYRKRGVWKHILNKDFCSRISFIWENADLFMWIYISLRFQENPPSVISQSRLPVYFTRQQDFCFHVNCIARKTKLIFSHIFFYVKCPCDITQVPVQRKFP